MPKIDWDKPIEWMYNDVSVPAEVISMTGGLTDTHCVHIKTKSTRASCTVDGHILSADGYIRNVQPETLFAQPEPDGFSSESPIRAFSDWDAGSHYAIGKGFRPSLGHLRPYLDAMEAKEGWQLVQLLEATTGKPTFIFRKAK